MNRKLAAVLLTAFLAFATAACDGGSSTDTDVTDTDSGIGMTYNGKLGYDYGSGFVQPFDGSSPSLGYGF